MTLRRHAALLSSLALLGTAEGAQEDLVSNPVRFRILEEPAAPKRGE